MRKTLGAIALLLLLAMGVVVNSLRPAPGVTARDAVGEKKKAQSDSHITSRVDYYTSGSGPDILLLASAGREVSDYNEIVRQLNTKNYTIIAVESAGIASSNLRKNPRLDEFAVSARLAMKFELKGPVILIGHAYGNRVVRMAAHQNPSNVKGVILLAAGGQVPMPSKTERSLKNIFNPLRPYRSRMKDVRYAFFADGNEIPDYWKRGWHTKTAMAQAGSVANSANDNSWHCAGGVPMLIVQPMQDRIAPIENAYALKDKCPQEVEIIEVQNAGHALLPEQPEAVAEAVLDFLAKHHPTDKNTQ